MNTMRYRGCLITLTNTRQVEIYGRKFETLEAAIDAIDDLAGKIKWPTNVTRKSQDCPDTLT